MPLSLSPLDWSSVDSFIYVKFEVFMKKLKRSFLAEARKTLAARNFLETVRGWRIILSKMRRKRELNEWT